jgi:hypothetical protein
LKQIEGIEIADGKRRLTLRISSASSSVAIRRLLDSFIVDDFDTNRERKKRSKK